MSRIKVDRITDKAGTGAPILVNGMNVTGKSTMGDIVGAAATFNSITGGSANFSSDVSIGGTLTYEDVKNIDSVGLITARTGIKVSAGGIDVSAGGIDITGNSNIAGNFGVGTNNPTTKLHVQQSAVTNAPSRTSALYLENNANCEIQFVGNSSNDCQLRFGTSSSSFKGAIEYELDNNNLKYYTNAAERLRIGSAGQIGIAGANYGTSGQVMTSQGGSAAPQWADAGGGAWALLQSASNPNTSTVDFVGLTTTYAAYKVVFMGANINSTNTREMRCRIYLGGALQTSAYRNLTSTIGVGQGGSPGAYAGLTGAILLSGVGNAAKGYNGELTFPMKLRTSGGVESLQAFYGKCITHDYCNTIGGFHEGSYSNLLTGIQFDSPDPYNVTDGQFYLYGLTRT